MNQHQLDALLDINHSYASQLELGRKTPTAVMILKIADLFGTTAASTTASPLAQNSAPPTAVLIPPSIVSNAFRTVSSAFGTVSNAFRTLTNPFRTLTNPFRTVSNAFRTVVNALGIVVWARDGVLGCCRGHANDLLNEDIGLIS